MQTNAFEKMMKHSIIYGYALSQSLPLLNVTEINEEKVNEQQPLFHDQLTTHSDKLLATYEISNQTIQQTLESTELINLPDGFDEKLILKLNRSSKTNMISEISPLLDTVSFGEQSNMVKEVQQVLAYYGYYEGEIDSIYGPLTERAIEQVNVEFFSSKFADQTVDDQITTDENLSVATEQSDSDLAVTGTSTQTTDNISLIDDDNQEEMIAEETNPLVIESTPVQSHDIITTAKQFIGVPYVWGGTAPAGFDCSGYIHYVYNLQQKLIPRTVSEIWNFASTVSNPSIGDLVFFETYQPGPSHIGIYLGNNEFIHAGVSNGVEISNLTESYWQTRYLGAKAIY